MPSPRKKSQAKPKRAPSTRKPARKPSRKAASPRVSVKPARKPSPPRSASPSRPLPASLVAAVRALDEKKAEQIRVIELGPLSSVADYFVLANGTSDPHLRALRIELDRVLEASGSRVRGIEAQKESGWVVVDAFDVIFHLFRPDQREAFRLEALWKDGAEVPLRTVLGG